MLKRLSELVTDGERVYHLGLRKEELAPNIFFAGDPARARRIAGRFDSIDFEISNREYLTFTGTFRGIPVSAIGTGIGTDNVEIALVELYILNEFDLKAKAKVGGDPLRIIRLGTSGGVQSDIEPGSQAIAAYGLGLDSTGIYYESEVPDEIAVRIEESANHLLDDSVSGGSRFKGAFRSYVSKASPDLVTSLEDAAGEAGIESRTGITVTSPGFYGPSSRFIEGIENVIPSIKHTLARLDVGGLRVLNMEMESSLLFHLCSLFGYPAATICAVISGPDESDALIDYEKAIGDTIDVGFAAMEKICHETI